MCVAFGLFIYLGYTDASIMYVCEDLSTFTELLQMNADSSDQYYKQTNKMNFLYVFILQFLCNSTNCSVQTVHSMFVQSCRIQ